MEHEELRAALERQDAILAGMMSVIAALVATHPNYRHLQLYLVTTAEIALEGGFGQQLLHTELQREFARYVAEVLQQTHEVPAGTIQPYRAPPV